MSSKVFIVTGASRGLGLAIAQALLQHSQSGPAPNKVLLVARSDADMQAVKAQHPGRAECLAADLSDLTIAPQVVEAAVKAFGRVDGLVVNHSTLSPIAKVADANPDEWRKAYDLNVLSPVTLVKEAIPELRKSGGRVVFVSSGASTSAYDGWSAYGTSKAALNHLCNHLVKEEPAITAVSVQPGKVDTAMQKQIRDEGRAGMTADLHDMFVQEHATGKLLPPELPGGVIAKLAERATKDLSGKLLRWNGAELADYQS